MKFTGNKSKMVQQLYLDLLNILETIGISMENLSDRRKEKMAGACLATGQIIESFKEVKSIMDGCFLKTRDIIEFENAHYGEQISSGSYDDIRRKDLKPLTDMGLVLSSSLLDQSATNNPHRGYALDAQFAGLLKVFGTSKWEAKLSYFLETRQKTKEELERKSAMERIPVTLPSGKTLQLSAGKHNLLQKKIIEEFLPQFGMGAQVYYVGDTTDKYLVREDDSLKAINFFPLEHDALPDVVAYSKAKNLLFLIEAYNTSGPMDNSRVLKLKALLKDCSAHVVFITAFLNSKEFLKQFSKIAWETEVWIADNPKHMIHLNGCKFLEVYQQNVKS